jgi:hypothetical protein
MEIWTLLIQSGVPSKMDEDPSERRYSLFEEICVLLMRNHDQLKELGLFGKK